MDVCSLAPWARAVGEVATRTVRAVAAPSPRRAEHYVSLFQCIRISTQSNNGPVVVTGTLYLQREENIIINLIMCDPSVYVSVSAHLLVYMCVDGRVGVNVCV